MKINALVEIRRRIAKGYKGELLYNFRAGQYEITTWLVGNAPDTKVHKFPRGMHDPNELKEAVYGKEILQ